MGSIKPQMRPCCSLSMFVRTKKSIAVFAKGRQLKKKKPLIAMSTRFSRNPKMLIQRPAQKREMTSIFTKPFFISFIPKNKLEINIPKAAKVSIEPIILGVVKAKSKGVESVCIKPIKNVIKDESKSKITKPRFSTKAFHPSLKSFMKDCVFSLSY